MLVGRVVAGRAYQRRRQGVEREPAILEESESFALFRRRYVLPLTCCCIFQLDLLSGSQVAAAGGGGGGAGTLGMSEMSTLLAMGVEVDGDD